MALAKTNSTILNIQKRSLVDLVTLQEDEIGIFGMLQLTSDFVTIQNGFKLVWHQLQELKRDRATLIQRMEETTVLQARTDKLVEGLKIEKACCVEELMKLRASALVSEVENTWLKVRLEAKSLSLGDGDEACVDLSPPKQPAHKVYPGRSRGKELRKKYDGRCKIANKEVEM